MCWNISHYDIVHFFKLQINIIKFCRLFHIYNKINWFQINQSIMQTDINWYFSIVSTIKWYEYMISHAANLRVSSTHQWRWFTTLGAHQAKPGTHFTKILWAHNSHLIRVLFAVLSGFSDAIMSQICTHHCSWAAMTYAKLWTDRIIIFQVTATWIFSRLSFDPLWNRSQDRSTDRSYSTTDELYLAK